MWGFYLFVVCILRIMKDGADNIEARPGDVYSDRMQLRRRNGCVEFMAFSRSGPWHCPETPQGSERMRVPKRLNFIGRAAGRL